MNCNKNYTVTFDEKVKGWTSFHSFYPEWMIGMNNNLFTFQNGNLYIHHSDEVNRNTYYGVEYPSKIALMFNDSPSDIKDIKAISLEGNYSWNTLISAFISSNDEYTNSTVNELEFVKKEGIWYAYARRNENTQQLDSKSAYGIGTVQSISGNDIIINGYSDTMISGDTLVRGSDLSVIGIIGNIERIGNVTKITINNPNNISFGDFVVGMKDARIEGGNLRGYTIRFDLELYKPDRIELFAVNAEVMKSFP